MNLFKINCVRKSVIQLKWEMQKVLRYEKGNPSSFIIVEMQILNTLIFISYQIFNNLKDWQYFLMVRLWGNRSYHALLGKVQLSTTLMEGNLVISIRTITAFIFWPSNFSSGCLSFYVYLHMYKCTRLLTSELLIKAYLRNNLSAHH